jgi:alpha-galactosidase
MRFTASLVAAGAALVLGAWVSSAQAQPAGAANADLSSYILTPAPAHTPRLTGPQIYGERPGRPFLFTLTATGDRPMTFSADGLPDGLKLDASTGQITGTVAKEGTFTIKAGAKNTLGSASRDLKIVIGDVIALTPPMGWNSWNSWAGQVDQDKVMSSAKILASSGLINHGWTYVNIDDTWQGKRTGPDHALQGNEKFPDLKGLCDDLHKMGLKAGTYSTPWITSYASYPGGSSDSPDGAWDKATLGNNTGHKVGKYHFDVADARQLAAWGFDYLKYDWDPIDVNNTKEMSDALHESGRDLVYSLSNTAPIAGGQNWAQLSNAWRTAGDIVDNWGRGNQSWQHGMAEIGFGEDRWILFAGPGHWNDPDMLVVGTVSLSQAMHRTHLTPDEQFTHISLWCLLDAPLLIGCDMTKLDPFTLSLLSNDEVLDLDQDSLGKQAKRVSGPAFVPQGGARGRGAAAAAPAPADNPGGNSLVYAKPMADGSIAVGLFNIGPSEGKVTATWNDIGATGKNVVRDLWRQKDLGTFENEFSATVPSHGVVLVKIKPAM